MRRLLFILALLPLGVWAQNEVAEADGSGDNDLGLWVEAGASKSLGKKWSIDAGLELRMRDNVSEVGRWSAGVGASFKPLKWLKLSGAYTWIYGYTGQKMKMKDNGYNVTEGYWKSKQRVTGDVGLQSPKLWRCIRVSARIRYQFTWRAPFDADRTKWRYETKKTLDDNFIETETVELKDGYPKEDPDHKPYESTQYLRNRVKVEWDKKRCAWSPYVSFEFYNDLTTDMTLTKTRLAVGTGYKISKQHELSAGYMFATEYEGADEHSHIINIGYEFKF